MEQLKTRLRQTLLSLMAINEVYPDENDVITYVEKRLKHPDILCQRDGFNNIIVKLPGVGEPVLLSTHLDIPEPAPDVRYTIDGDTIRSDGTNILGVDPKAGLAVLIELIIDLTDRPRDSHVPIELLLTRGEEAGLHGARQADYSLIQSKLCLVLDEDGPVTQVVTQAPAFGRIDAKFTGKVVHAREPENGINALHAACDALMSLPWDYAAPGVTWNVGLFQAGTAGNSIPGIATLKGELRSFDTAKVKEASDRIERTMREVAKKHGTSIDIENTIEFEGYRIEETHPLIRRLDATYSRLELSPNYFSTFGGSDANILNTHGIASVVLGCGYYNAHQYTEFVHVNEMEGVYRFLREFVRAS